MYFDEKLKALRETRGLSLTEAAEKLDISEAGLEAMEAGFKDPDAREMKKIKEFYQVSEEDLADDEPYVNAFSLLFQNSEMEESNLGSSLALAAGMMGSQKKNSAAANKEIPLVEDLKLVAGKTQYQLTGKNIIGSELAEGEYLAVKVLQNDLKNSGIFPEDLAIVQVHATGNLHDVVCTLDENGYNFKISAKPADPAIYGKVIEIRRYL